MRLGLCLNDVGIGASIAVECANAVVIERIRSQPDYVRISRIAHIAILVARHVCARDKGAGCGDV